MWVIFEGLDKTGKTTLEWEFLKATNFKHVVVDRGPMGYMTFDKLFGRDTKLGNQEFIQQARKVMKQSGNTMVVYCYANEDVVNKRLNDHGEKLLHEVEPYKGRPYNKVQKLYAVNVSRYYKPEKTLMLDTSDKTIEECIQLIKEKMEEVLKGEL